MSAAREIITPYTALDLSFDASILVLALYELYMSKIDVKDANTRTQSLRRSEICQFLAEKKKYVRPERFREALIDLTNKPAVLRNGDMIDIIYLFEKISYNEADVDPEVFITCTQTALPLFFLLKQQGYVKHPPVALDLKSATAFNLYNFLLRNLYKAVNFNKGKIVVSIEDLKRQLKPEIDQITLGKKKEKYYAEWFDFRRKVLQPASDRVNAETELKHTFEPVKRVGLGNHYFEVAFTLDDALVKTLRKKYAEAKAAQETRKKEIEAASDAAQKQ